MLTYFIGLIHIRQGRYGEGFCDEGKRSEGEKC